MKMTDIEIVNNRVYINKEDKSTIYIYNGYSAEMKILEEEKVLLLKVVDNMSYMPLYVIEVLDETKLNTEKYKNLFETALTQSENEKI